jgi:hypothetical protein
MSDVTVKINKKTFKLRFGLGVFEALGEKWNLPSLMTVQQHVLSTLSGMTEDVTFKQLSVINDLILASIECNDENKEQLTKKELQDMYLKDTKNLLDVVSIVMKEFIKSLEQPKEVPATGKPKAPRIGAKKNI